MITRQHPWRQNPEMNFEEDRIANARRDLDRHAAYKSPASRITASLFFAPKNSCHQSHRSRRPISVLPPLQGSARAVNGLLELVREQLGNTSPDAATAPWARRLRLQWLTNKSLELHPLN